LLCDALGNFLEEATSVAMVFALSAGGLGFFVGVVVE
jgi:hypothetical protein